MKSKTYNLLVRLADQKLKILEAEQAQIKTKKDWNEAAIGGIGEMVANEHKVENIIHSDFFDVAAQLIAQHRKAVSELQVDMQQRQQHIIEAWQKKEVLHMWGKKNMKNSND